MTDHTTRSELEKRALADARRVLADIAATIKTAAILAIPLVIRGACVAAAVIGVGYALPVTWAAYGGDLPALIPAMVIAVLPLAAALLSRHTWGGLLLAGVATFATGAVIENVPAVVRVMLIAAVTSGLVFYTIKTIGGGDEQSER